MGTIMRVLLALLLVGCTVQTEPPATSDGGAGGFGGDGGFGGAGGEVCVPDTTATVYQCGDGWTILWPGKTLECGTFTAPCVASDETPMVCGDELELPFVAGTCVKH